MQTAVFLSKHSMETLLLLAVLFVVSFPVLYYLLRSNYSTGSSGRGPPGSMGLPVIGGTIGFLRSMSANKLDEWASRHIRKYGPVSKHFLFGTPTVLLAGPAANKFLFTNDMLVPQQVKPLARLIGEKNVMQLVGDEHRRVRGTIVQSLRVSVLRKYVARIDEEVRHHIDSYWTGRKSVQVLPLAKNFTLDSSCSVLFGIERGAFRNEMKSEFIDVMDGVWLSGLGQFFLNMSRSTGASRRARTGLNRILQERKSLLEQGLRFSDEDFITCLLSLGKQDFSQALTDEEIVDNAMLLLIAGYDTSSILITYMIYYLSNNQRILDEVTREQEEIANSKASRDDALTWEDVQKMKYTWQVAMETLRMVPPTFGSLRKVLEDVRFNGYLIPKGWHVLWIANVTQMDENIFSDPKSFNPARFENKSSTLPYTFVSFGGGPRVCPGTEFAKLQTLVLMHYLVTGFKWRLSSEDPEWRMCHAPSPMKGLPIDLQPKN